MNYSLNKSELVLHFRFRPLKIDLKKMPGFIHRLFGRDDLDVDCLQDGMPEFKKKYFIDVLYLRKYIVEQRIQ